LIQRSSLYLLAIMSVALGCSQKQPSTAPAPENPYANALAAAERKVEAGDYSGADRILADFSLKAKDSEDAAEVAFYRALYMVDPNNRNASMAEGVRALDIYLNTSKVKRYRAEALVLKRTAQAVLALRAAQNPPRLAGRDTVFVNREDEIASLKDQLAKANAELERIKKRLADPRR
jgi:hypothetical protein